MRDDIKILFHRMLKELNKKMSLLNSIREREADKHYYIKTDAVFELLTEIERDESSYALVDLIDFDIAGFKKEISEIAGIPPDKFDSYILSQKSEITLEYSRLTREIGRMLRDLIEERDRLIENIETKKDGIEADLKSLKRIRQLSDSD